MAYSDYGGYAYRNGERVEDRSDFTITPDGGFGTPGCYPGFAMLAAGVPHEEVMQSISNHTYAHAVLGDGPIYVSLYKQSSIRFHRIADGKVYDIRIEDAKHDLPDDMFSEYEGKRYLKSRYDHPDDIEISAELDGWRLSVTLTEEDNYYTYAKLTQPDGTVWTGFSGYGVGAGLEDAGYGFSTADRESVLAETYPATPLSGES